MKKVEIFDPALCCSTGLCGATINKELMRISVIVDTLKRRGADVERHNLKDDPAAYLSNPVVKEYLEEHGAEALPITLVDGAIATTRAYPSTRLIGEWTGIDLEMVPVMNK